MKRNGFLYVGLAVGLGLLAALLLIEMPAIADAGPPRPTRPPGERGEWIRPREAHRVPALGAESSTTRPLGSSSSEYNVSLFFDDMESGSANWTWDGLWHLITDTHPSGWGNSFSPVTSWWYGQNSTGDYDTGATHWGSITTTDPISLPASLSQVHLSFWSWEHTECGDGTCEYDIREVDITTSTAAPAWTPLWRTTDDTTVEEGWHWVELDLSPYTGNDILLRFQFDTTDDVDNSYRGWYVDDVAVGYDPADLTPEFQVGSGERGTAVDYTLTLRNQTERSDSFDLAVAGNDWPTTLSTSNTGPIAHDGWVTFTVRVDVPAWALFGDVDIADVTATSVLSPTVYSDTATINTIVFHYGYVFNPEDEEIDVVNTVLHMDTGMAIDTSPYGDFVFRGALSPNGQWLYASLRNSDRVLVVDTATHTAVITLPVGSEPHGIAFTADSATAFVANQNGDTVSVIDTSVPAVTATIPVGDEPYSVASSPCLGKVYVTNWDDDTVSVIDVGTLAVTTVITGFDGPRDAVISPYGHRAYVSNQEDGTIGVIDTASDSLVDTWDIGGEWLAGLDISPDGRTLYVADNDDNVTYAVDAFTGQVVATLPTGDDSWDVEVFPASAGPFAYVSAPWDNDVKVVNVDSNTIVDTIPLGGYPRGLALFPPSTVCGQLPRADFTPAQSIIPVGDTVAFTNQSSGVPAPTYTWDFGDGSPLDHAVHPAHTYDSSGTFTVILTATNLYDRDVATGTVDVGVPPTAAFEPTMSIIRPGDTVTFANLSTGDAPLSYDWDFGDGSALSHAVNPAHTYVSAGTFTTWLTATNPFGSSSAHGQVRVAFNVYLPLVTRNS